MIRDAQEILERLPELLRATPELRYRLYEVIAEEFPPRREMERLLAELAAMREESNRRFEEVDRRFEAVDRRFAEVDHRFEAVLAELAAQREESNRRFAEQREETNRRFEAVDQRFEAVLAELATQRKETNRRFEEQREETNRRFEALAQQNQRLTDMVQYQNATIGGLQNRAGRNLEDMAAGMLRFGLGITGIRPEHIRLRQRIEDRTGLIGPAGRRYEYDILVINGRVCVFEVKSAPDEEDVDRFRDKCDLVEHELGRGPIERVLATLGKTPELQRYCDEHGVVLV
ncbi:MAG: hypothetical protein HYV63_11815 [Candidatus Schekmanbacteria bacterium]|nr:hypothetical protein [Candidatus Schekmanbacteria bacterium]